MEKSIRLSLGFRLVLSIVLALLVLGPSWTVPRIARAAGNFVVNTSADNNASDNFLTLREAILVANGSLPGPFSAAEQAQLGGCTFDGGGYLTGGCGAGVFDNITFDPSASQVNLTSALPLLTDAGTWINGNAGVPRIDASGMSGNVFAIDGNDITISNLSIVNGDPSGIFADINLLGGKDARIAYNYLGTVSGAANCAPSGVTRNSYYGVHVWPNSSGGSGANNGVAYIYGNTIGCHSQDGIFVLGADYVYVGVQADGVTGTLNYIGTNNSGANLANGGDGVYFGADGTDGVRYGFISSNQIWNNTGNGIHLQGTGSNSAGSTTLNYIKLNTVYANGQSGLRLTAGAYTNFIGGGTSADPNKFGWNSANGITILNSNHNLIQGNGIGVNETLDRGNSQAGVYLENAHENTITGNVISANDLAGVWAYNSNYNQ